MTPGRPPLRSGPDPDRDLHELGTLVERALTIADRLGLWGVGISLDTARVDLTRLTGEPEEHPTLQ